MYIEIHVNICLDIKSLSLINIFCLSLMPLIVIVIFGLWEHGLWEQGLCLYISYVPFPHVPTVNYRAQNIISAQQSLIDQLSVYDNDFTEEYHDEQAWYLYKIMGWRRKCQIYLSYLLLSFYVRTNIRFPMYWSSYL